MENHGRSLLSIVLPAFNVEKYIQRSVESVLRQTHKELELMAVNDCANDRTGDILDALAAQDSRLRVIHLGENVGVHASRAIGVQASRGSHIGFIDADDWVAPEMYAKLLEACNRDDADIAICGAVSASAIDQLGGAKVRFSCRQTIDADLLARFCALEFGSGVLWNKLYRASLIRPYAALQLERRVDAAEDYIVNVGCFADASRVVTLPEVYYYYYERSDSASRVGSGAKNFSRTLRAYAVCLETYRALPCEQRNQIESLYARQLRYDCYRVVSETELQPFEDELRESLQRLALVHPASIYSLIHVFDRHGRPKQVGLRAALTGLYSAGKAVASAAFRYAFRSAPKWRRVRRGRNRERL